MKPRAVTAAGWLTGMILILSGLPLLLALAVPAALTGAAVAYARLGGQNLVPLARDVLRLRRLVRRAGGAVERA